MRTKIISYLVLCTLLPLFGNGQSLDASTAGQTGVLIIDLCVDGAGQVISAEFNPEDSDNWSEKTIAIAIANAKKWKFDTSNLEVQCGKITYNFKYAEEGTESAIRLEDSTKFKVLPLDTVIIRQSRH